MATLEEHNADELAKFSTATFEDGVEAGGDMTPEEQAALAANAAVEVPPGAQAPNEVKDDKPAKEPGAPDPAAIAAAAKAAKEPKTPPAADPNAKPWAPPKTEAEFQAAIAAAAEAQAKTMATKRIGELTGTVKALERQLAEAKVAKQPATAEGGLTPPAASGTTEKSVAPDPSKFTYGELDPEYIAALAKHTVSTTLADKDAKDADVRQAQAAAAAQAEFVQKRDKAITAGTADYPDFNETVVESAARNEWPLTETLGNLIFDSAHGHHVAYYLATHADEAKELAKQSPQNQAKWFGRVEAAFEGGTPSQPAKEPTPAAQKQVKAPKAPPPLKEPAGAQTTHDVGTDTDDFAAFERLMRDRARR